MVQASPLWKLGGRSLWTLLFLLLATVSMIGPTYAVAGIAKASVVVSETFAQLLSAEAMPAVTSAASKGAAPDDDALPLDASQLTELVPRLATEDTEPLARGQAAGADADVSSQNVRRSRSAGEGGSSGEIGGNGHVVTPGGSSGLGPTGDRAASRGYVFGQDEAISQLTQELGMPAPASEPTALSLAQRAGHDGVVGSSTGDSPTAPTPRPDPPLDGPPFARGSSGFGPRLEDVLTDVTPAFSAPDRPTATGTPPNASAPSDGAAPDNGALWPSAHPTGSLLAGSVISLDDEPSAGQSASDVAQVPEPSTLMMLSLGAIALARRRNSGRTRN